MIVLLLMARTRLKIPQSINTRAGVHTPKALDAKKPDRKSPQNPIPKP